MYGRTTKCLNMGRHENTIYQQIFPAQIPQRRLVAEKKSGSSTTSSTAGSVAHHSDAANLPSSYSFDYLYPPASRTQTVYDETVKVSACGIRCVCMVALCWVCLHVSDHARASRWLDGSPTFRIYRYIQATWLCNGWMAHLLSCYMTGRDHGGNGRLPLVGVSLRTDWHGQDVHHAGPSDNSKSKLCRRRTHGSIVCVFVL